MSGLEVIDVTGAVKWYDPMKGYGFLVADNGAGDVLLHQTCLRAGGYQTAYEGARISGQALKRPKGLQLFRILAMDETNAACTNLSPRTHVVVEPESEWQRARVKWFNPVRGFGFLHTGDDLPDIFIHQKTLRRHGFITLTPDQEVDVRWGNGIKGCMAAEIRAVQ